VKKVRFGIEKVGIEKVGFKKVGFEKVGFEQSRARTKDNVGYRDHEVDLHPDQQEDIIERLTVTSEISFSLQGWNTLILTWRNRMS